MCIWSGLSWALYPECSSSIPLLIILIEHESKFWFTGRLTPFFAVMLRGSLSVVFWFVNQIWLNVTVSSSWNWADFLPENEFFLKVLENDLRLHFLNISYSNCSGCTSFWRMVILILSCKYKISQIFFGSHSRCHLEAGPSHLGKYIPHG